MIFLLQQHQQTLLNQLREVTGTTDVQLLQQALQVHFETQAKNWKSQGYCVFTVEIFSVGNVRVFCLKLSQFILMGLLTQVTLCSHFSQSKVLLCIKCRHF